jgi:hypothetical protein
MIIRSNPCGNLFTGANEPVSKFILGLPMSFDRLRTNG